MRIWYQYPGPVSAFRRDVVWESVHGVLNRVKRADTHVDIVAPPYGVTDWKLWTTDYARNLSDQVIIDTVSQAEEKGYDGAIIGMSHDPGLHEAKELLNIPVVGLTEAGCHFATLWGDKFGIITNAASPVSPHAKGLHGRWEMLRRYHVADQCVGITPIDMPQDKYLKDLADRNHDEILTRFDRIAREHISKGAEVILVGDTVLSMTLTSHNIFEVAGTGAVLVDLMTSAIKLVEALVDIKQAFGTVRSRAGIYAGASPDTIAEVRRIFGRSIPPQAPGN